MSRQSQESARRRLGDLESHSCYCSDEDEQKMIQVRACMAGTNVACSLSEDEDGVQKVGLTNWRSHVATIELEVKSLNNQILVAPGSTDDADDEYTHTQELNIPPSQYGDQQEITLNIPAKRKTNSMVSNDTIQISLVIDYDQALGDSRQGPTLHSKISLT